MAFQLTIKTTQSHEAVAMSYHLKSHREKKKNKLYLQMMSKEEYITHEVASRLFHKNRYFRTCNDRN